MRRHRHYSIVEHDHPRNYQYHDRRYPLEGFCKDQVQFRYMNCKPISGIIHIGDLFLARCYRLRVIDLGPLCMVQTIRNDFMSGCNSIRSIDLSPLSKLQRIGNGFLNACPCLNNIDLSPLSNVIEIGDNFITHSSMHMIDISPLVSLRKIGSRFLAHGGFREIKIGNALICVKEIPPLFLTGNTFLLNIEYGYVGADRIGDGFMAFCKIPMVTMSAFSKVREIGMNFLERVTSLSVNFDGLDLVERVGADFLANMRGPAEIDTSPMISLRHIGDSFCSGLEIRTLLFNCPNIVTIGNTFFSTGKCDTLIFTNAPVLTEIGANFCRDLDKHSYKAIFGEMPAIEKVGLFATRALKLSIIPEVHPLVIPQHILEHLKKSKLRSP